MVVKTRSTTSLKGKGSSLKGRKGVKIGKYTYYKSTKFPKKLMVNVKGRWIHFGDRRYQHYKDRTGFYKSLDHLDPERRRRYKIRHSAIILRSGKKAVSDPTKAAYHALRILW